MNSLMTLGFVPYNIRYLRSMLQQLDVSTKHASLQYQIVMKATNTAMHIWKFKTKLQLDKDTSIGAPWRVKTQSEG